ncbi:NAD(P)H-binding protein [candidate division KSB1 bacterium]|nr:NAD(P)H-binding protein [candidate division KSB1 bacterium]
MTILIAGASGATGRLLLDQLLNLGHKVKIIVRSTQNISKTILENENLTVVEGSILELTDEKLVKTVNGCDAIASCLGHMPNMSGLFGQPRKLVTETTRRLCHAVKANKPSNKIKYVLMNTAGNSNRDLSEKISFGQKIVIALLRLLLPPHVDNENAADYLRVEINQNDNFMQWVVIRPDKLINESAVSEYNLYPSPIRSALFDAGKTSRINVANFMVRLIADNELWEKWQGQMPVIYNEEIVS